MSRIRGWWFDLVYVMISRPIDLDRYRVFRSTWEWNEGTVVTSSSGGQSTWVPRWRVRQYERAGWVRGMGSWPIA